MTKIYSHFSSAISNVCKSQIKARNELKNLYFLAHRRKYLINSKLPINYNRLSQSAENNLSLQHSSSNRRSNIDVYGKRKLDIEKHGLHKN